MPLNVEVKFIPIEETLSPLIFHIVNNIRKGVVVLGKFTIYICRALSVLIVHIVSVLHEGDDTLRVRGS